MEIDYCGIGKRIRERRNFLGYSQEEMAFECGFSAPYISMIENGRKAVSLNALLQIADTIDCTLDWLVFGYDSSESNYKNLLKNYSPEEQQFFYDLLSANMKLINSKRARRKNNIAYQ